MGKRFVCIGFRHLLTDWLTVRRPALKDIPFVVIAPDHGRLLIVAANEIAAKYGITKGMASADAKAMVPELQVIDAVPGKEERLLKALAGWCIRYTPFVGVQLSDGLVLQADGCTHLWGGESGYIQEITNRLKGNGYTVRIAIADTIGAAWAISRFGRISPIVESGSQSQALLDLSPAALRLEPALVTKLQRLGFRTIRNFISLQRSALRRRFGTDLLLRLDQALGNEAETFHPIQPAEPFHERLPSLEPVRTAPGIAIAIQTLLGNVCKRLYQEGMGLRLGILKCYRIDGQVQEAQIGTNKASCDPHHLFKLFELKIPAIEPALGIELFTLDVPKADPLEQAQEAIWKGSTGLEDQSITELLDRLSGKLGAASIHRYLPAEHYWPERAIIQAGSIDDKPVISWRTDKRRPVKLLRHPEKIAVTAPIPDYPPMLFIYKGIRHLVKKADGPERIEREWWLESGEHRDYYQLEDEAGRRYWIFRSGHYDETRSDWFLHGFFA